MLLDFYVVIRYADARHTQRFNLSWCSFSEAAKEVELSVNAVYETHGVLPLSVSIDVIKEREINVEVS